VLPPNSATVYGYHSPQGYDSLSIVDYYGFAQRIEDGSPAPVENGNMMLLENYASPLLAAAAVKWIVSREPLRGDDLKLLWQGEGTYLYEGACAPRFQILTPEGKPAGDFPAIPGRSYVHSGLNCVRLDLPHSGPWTVLAADKWYPGWLAIRGPHIVAIKHYHEIFRKMDLPAENEIPPFHDQDTFRPEWASGMGGLLMVYYPTSVLCGLFVTLLATGVLAALVVGCWMAALKSGSRS